MTVNIIKQHIPKIKKKYSIDFIIANGDGASDGFGILRRTAEDLLDNGVNVLTSGDLVYNKKDMKGFLDCTNKMIRPYNLPITSPGKGYTITNIDDKNKIAVISLIGRAGYNKLYGNDPFRAVDSAIKDVSKQARLIIVDFHGGTTGEIQAFNHYVDGKVTSSLGTGLKVLTTDNRVTKNGSAVITGTGFCGAYNSIGGLHPATEIRKIKTGTKR